MLFIGWQVWFESERNELPLYGGIEVMNEGLQLLSELDEKERPAQRKIVVVEDKAVETTVAPVELIEVEESREHIRQEMVATTEVAQCYQSSPLANLDDAKALQHTLVELGIKGSQRETVQIQKVNYWVMLKAYKTRAKADEAADILRKNRVTDFFIVRSGRYENAVSLGVYSTRERAEQRYKEISGRKLRLRKPVIEALELPAKRLIISFKLEQGVVSDGLTALQDSSKQPHLKKIPCN